MLAPSIEIAHHGNVSRVRSPHRKFRAWVPVLHRQMSAQTVGQSRVRAFFQIVEVLIVEQTHGSRRKPYASSVRMPRSGILTHAGRLFSS